MIYNIDNLTIEEKAFRNVIYTDDNMQVVLMFIKANDEIGEEIHENTSQFIKVVSGIGLAVIDGYSYELHPGQAVIIPPNKLHNIYAYDDLSLYTIYSGEILHNDNEYITYD